MGIERIMVLIAGLRERNAMPVAIPRLLEREDALKELMGLIGKTQREEVNRRSPPSPGYHGYGQPPPLLFAMQLGVGTAVEALLKQGADPNFPEGAPLRFAISDGDVALVRTLLAAGAEPGLLSGNRWLVSDLRNEREAIDILELAVQYTKSPADTRRKLEEALADRAIEYDGVRRFIFDKLGIDPARDTPKGTAVKFKKGPKRLQGLRTGRQALHVYYREHPSWALTLVEGEVAQASGWVMGQEEGASLIEHAERCGVWMAPWRVFVLRLAGSAWSIIAWAPDGGMDDRTRALAAAEAISRDLGTRAIACIASGENEGVVVWDRGRQVESLEPDIETEKEGEDPLARLGVFVPAMALEQAKAQEHLVLFALTKQDVERVDYVARW